MFSRTYTDRLQHKKDHRAQQYKNEHSADAGSNKLHIPIADSLFLSHYRFFLNIYITELLLPFFANVLSHALPPLYIPFKNGKALPL